MTSQLCSTVSANVTDNLLQTVMPQIDMQIKKHIDENDKVRQYDQKLGAAEKAVQDVTKKTQNDVDNLSNQLQKEI